MSDTPIALDAYQELAEAYAAKIETKPHNAYYERPATLSLLPDVRGKRVLDAGCGPGLYAQLLKDRGANVVSLDASPKMIELARKRLGDDADLRIADLGKPLELDPVSFDLVLSPLVMDYIEDWHATFAEFHRVLKPGGQFIFSVGHPFSDYLYFKSEKYFETEFVGSEWLGFAPVKVYVPTFRRSLGSIFAPLTDAGFTIEKVIEPMPTEEFKKADPRHYAELSSMPAFICLRAIASVGIDAT